MINCLCLRNHHNHARFMAFVALFRKQSTGCDAGGGGSCRAARQLQGPFRPLDKLGQRHRRMRCTGHGDDTMSALRFRNITASVEDPVETWPFEGILTAVERGTLPDWRRLAAAIRADPWGPVAQQVSEAVEISHPYGTSELLTSVIEQAREEAANAEREEVAREIRDLVSGSGLSQQDFALRLGTSRPRLSTYMSGKVTPSAALMIRMRRVATQALARMQTARSARQVARAVFLMSRVS